MDKIEKLLQKISKKDRERLLNIIKRLVGGDKALKFEKIKNTDFYKVRSGHFRIIFHRDSGEVIIDAIKIRSESTYEHL